MKNKKTKITILAYLSVGLLFTLLTILSTDLSRAEGREALEKAGNTKIDSLKSVIETADHDTTIIKALLQWDNLIYISDPKLDLKLNQRILQLCETNLNRNLTDTEKKFFTDKLATTYNNIGIIYHTQSDYSLALEYYFKSLKIQEKLGNKQGMASSYNNIGIIYKNQSDYPLALEYYFKSLKIQGKLGNKQGIASSYNNIGIIYKNQSDYPLALENYFKSLKIEEELGNKQGMAISYNNIGNIYENLSYQSTDDSVRLAGYPLALEYYFKSLKIQEELGDKRGIATSYTNIGNLYTSIYEQALAQSYDGDDNPPVDGAGGRTPSVTSYLDSALYYQQKALDFQTELSAEYDMTFSLSGIAAVYFRKGEYTHALEYYHQAVLLANSIGALKEASDAHSGLTECYEKLDLHKLALEHFKQYSTLKDTVYNEEKSKEIGRLEAGYEYEMQLQEQRLEQEKKEALAEERANKQRIVIWSVSVGLLLVVVFFLLLFNRFRIIRSQKNIIQEQKALVDEKNKNITDSIRYAKEIQEAILPTDEEIAELLPESFVLFKPKDIVSGDFYWITRTKDNKAIWATVDCTGHGVPGAFMSMIGNALLNEIVIEKGITEPARILNELKTHIIDSLSQTGASGEHRDGMDIALCVLDKKTNKLEFAGANNPLYIVRTVNDNKIVILNEAKRSEESPASKSKLAGDSSLRSATLHSTQNDISRAR